MKVEKQLKLAALKIETMSSKEIAALTLYSVVARLRAFEDLRVYKD